MVGEATREVTRNDIRYNRVENELNRVKDELNRVKDELEPTTKNNLEVDCVSRKEVEKLVYRFLQSRELKRESEDKEWQSVN